MLKLDISPTDTITDIKINNSLIYISSFDSYIYIYDIWSRKLINKIQNDAPILKMNFIENLIYTDTNGFVNFTNLKKFNFNIKGMSVLEKYKNIPIVGGLSKVLLLYDNGCYEILTNQKVYGSSIYEDIIALNFGLKIGLFDLRCLKFINWFKNKHFIRTIYLNKNKLYLGDINGRIRIYNIDNLQDLIINSYVSLDNENKILSPVNDIIFENYIYTCGSDGIVNRLKENPKLCNKIVFKVDQPVLKIGKFENFLVACCGYNYEFGEGETSKNPVYIVTI